MERTQLIFFMKAAELEHFTKAAEALNVSQPYLSNSISELEGELGVQLFDRVGRGIKLNRYGQKLYEYALKFACTERDIINELREMKSEERTSLYVATNASIYMPWLFRYIIDTVPEIRLHLYLLPKGELYRRLDRGEIDFVILGPEVKNGYCSEVLIDESGIVVWPDGHWLKDRKEIDLRSILDESIISIREGYAMSDYIDKFFMEERHRFKSSLETVDTNSALQFVKAGVGLAMAPASTLKLDPYFLNHYTFITDAPSGTIHLVWRDGQYLDTISQSFIRAAQAFFTKLDEDTKSLLR